MDKENLFMEMLNSSSAQGKDALIAFSAYIHSVGFKAELLPVFFKLFQKQIPEIYDNLFLNRQPVQFFSTVTPDPHSLDLTFEILSEMKPGTADPRGLAALLGLLQNAYKKAEDGIQLRRLSVTEVQHLGKFLVLGSDVETTDLILDLLDSFSSLSGARGNELAVLSRNIRTAFFDNTKRLSDFIPQNLMVE